MLRYLTYPLLLALSIATCFSSPTIAADSPPITRPQLDNAITLAADYLTRQVGPDGKFIYRINLNPQVRVADRYNILRHAGSIYAMCQYAQTRDAPQTHLAISRASDFMIRETVRPVPNVPDVLAVWSDPAMWGEIGLSEAKLGAAGLA